MSTTDTGDLTWGHLEDTEMYGRRTAIEDFIQVSADALRSNYQLNHEASHCLIYAKNEKRILDVYKPRATILMQLRFDGYIGFPGGLIDAGEDAVSSLNRELQEEMYFDLSKHTVKENDYVVSHYNKNYNLGLHFYALEVTMEELEAIELRALRAKDYGTEVMGTIRIPLYTMGDGYRGLPVFLKHQFIGNAKEQLLYTIKMRNLMTEDEILKAVNAQQQ